MMKPSLTPLVVFGNAALAFSVAACGGSSSTVTPDAASVADATTGSDAASGCAAGAAGLACVFALYDSVNAACSPAGVALLRSELEQRAALGPLWLDGIALFRTSATRAIAGEFNNWSTTALTTSSFCNSDLFLARATIATGYWQYKIVDAAASGATAWQLDSNNPAFAYDAFAGNADGRNSVLNTPGSGRGHLVNLGTLASTTLGNTRNLTGYLPPDYNAPANATRTYPALLMHDGQNIFDDTDCCFGHTGWEVNLTLDREIAARRVAPVVVVAADHAGAARRDEYGFAVSVGGKIETFISFFVDSFMPRAAQLVRIDPTRRFVAGSSLGGLISMRIALAHPDLFAGAGSLSGAFWPGQDTNTALRNVLPTVGKKPFGIYLDHGGAVADGSDGAGDSIEIRNQMATLGWQQQTSPQCTLSMNSLCYHHEVGATHDELAWRDRVWRMLRYFFPA
jgi:predicted alpha/beta superfamily hydrolase